MRLREILRERLPQGIRMLVATAVQTERDAVLRGLSTADNPIGRPQIVVEVVGVGPARAAAATSRLLTLGEADGLPYACVVSAGIAGGFLPHAEIGAIVLGSRSVAADFGIESSHGFEPIADAGLGVSTVDADPDLLEAVRSELPTAKVGEILTVTTVTGTQDRAMQLAERHPLAIAEGMEGFGVAMAAVVADIAFLELRTIANPVGPRDRDAWRIDDALAALAVAAAALDPVVRASTKPTASEHRSAARPEARNERGGEQA